VKLNNTIKKLIEDINDFQDLGMPEKDIRQNLVFILERQYQVPLHQLGPVIEKLLKLANENKSVA